MGFRSQSAVAITPEILAPTTYVVCAHADRSLPLISIRRNGVQVATSSNSQGAVNFANQVLNLFCRNQTGARFNGQTFALIVAGGSYSESTIEKVEKILAKYTPGVTL